MIHFHRDQRTPPVKGYAHQASMCYNYHTDLRLINATYPATEVAGFICEVLLRGLEGEPPQGGFATEARSFLLLGVEH